MMDRPIPPFYCVYLLRSTQRNASLYVGSTPHPHRRLKQHNGGTKGGPKRTAGKSLRPWELTVFVTGFPSKIAALQFEWAWQNTHFTRHITEDKRITKPAFRTVRGRHRVCKPPDSILDKIKNLHLLLRVDSFKQWPLAVRFFSKHVFDIWQKWHNQQTEAVPDGIPVCLDQTPINHTSAANVTTAINSPLQTGLEALDVSYAPLRPSIKQSIDVLNGNQQIYCVVCHERLNRGTDLILVCPNNGCDMTSHLSCLAENFLASESDSNAILPSQGSCPTCATKLRWADLMRDLSLRERGQAQLQAIMKEPGRKKANPAGHVNGDSFETATVGTSVSESAANQIHGQDDHGFVGHLNMNDESLDDTTEEEPEYREEVSEMAVSDWDNIDDIEGSELESEANEDLRIIMQQSALEEAETLAPQNRIPTVIPDSEFEDIDDLVD